MDEFTNKQANTEVLIEEYIKPKNNESWFGYFDGYLSIMRISTISTARLFLYFPFIVSMCGIANYLLWLIVVTFISEIKASSLIAASIEEGKDDYIYLLNRSVKRYTFLVFLLIEILAGLIDYLFLMMQIKEIIGIFYADIPKYYMFGILSGLSVGFTLVLFAKAKVRAQATKLISYGSVITVVGLTLFGIILFTPNTLDFDDFINFKSQKNLISLILLMSAFKYNREILQLYSWAGKHDKSMMRKHSCIKMVYFLVVALVFGLVFFTTYLADYVHDETFSIKSALFFYSKLPIVCKLMMIPQICVLLDCLNDNVDNVYQFGELFYSVGIKRFTKLTIALSMSIISPIIIVFSSFIGIINAMAFTAPLTFVSIPLMINIRLIPAQPLWEILSRSSLIAIFVFISIYCTINTHVIDLN